ncbi:hypothetical protein AQUCO_31800001v1 [Aquilegia coerulea]|uniref:F-box domain-containing protein n=1 Tax=Aquilegia coerulea TaxID=218851 RepID=A0A2G5C0K6_AQUCA|nr:hypothetical protein AQUCO_31800001v1 [Aquilegia coerulea]
MMNKRYKRTTSYLPGNVLFFGILCRLPVKSLLRFKCVSSLWYVIINCNPKFIQSHLICSTESSRSLTIVVQAVYKNGNGNFCRCMVFTLGTNSWKDITTASNLSKCIYHNEFKGNRSLGGNAKSYRAIYSNGALHWFYSPANIILSFNLQNEIFSLKRGPIPGTSVTSWPRYLIEWQGSLCVAFHDVPRFMVYIYQYKWRENKFDGIRRTILFPFKPDSGIGFLGGESSLLYWYNGAFLSWYKAKSGFGYNNPTETMEWFADLRNVDYKLMTECEFIPRVENLVSLKTFVQVKSVTCL